MTFDITAPLGRERKGHLAHSGRNTTLCGRHAGGVWDSVTGEGAIASTAYIGVHYECVRQALALHRQWEDSEVIKAEMRLES